MIRTDLIIAEIEEKRKNALASPDSRSRFVAENNEGFSYALLVFPQQARVLVEGGYDFSNDKVHNSFFNKPVPARDFISSAARHQMLHGLKKGEFSYIALEEKISMATLAKRDAKFRIGYLNRRSHIAGRDERN